MAKHSTAKADWLRQLREDQAKAHESRGGPANSGGSIAKDRAPEAPPTITSDGVPDAAVASSPRVLTNKLNRDVGGSFKPIAELSKATKPLAAVRTTGKQDQVAPVSEVQTIVAGGSSRVIADKPSRGPKKGTGGRPRIGEGKDTLSHTKPWAALGMSQSTWYRRKRNEKR